MGKVLETIARSREQEESHELGTIRPGNSPL